MLGQLETESDGVFIDMSIVVTNQYQQPYFRLQHDLKHWPRRRLLHALEASANQDKQFRFSASYYGELGYMITTINGLSASTVDQTFWKISSNITGTLQVGVSSYTPQNNEIITFNFETYSTSEDCTESKSQTNGSETA